MNNPRQNKGFAKIPNPAYFSAKLDIHAYAVYCALQHYTDRNGVCFPSQETIASVLRISRPTVIKAIKRLRALNMIQASKKDRNGIGKWRSFTYKMLDPSQWIIQDNLIDKATLSKDRAESSQSRLPHVVNFRNTNKNYLKQDKRITRNFQIECGKPLGAVKAQAWEQKNDTIKKEASKNKYKIMNVNGVPQFIKTKEGVQ